MDSRKILNVVFIFTVWFLFANCQPTVRFASNRQCDNNNKTDNNLVENRVKNDANKNIQQSNIHYAQPAKTIYPSSKINKHSNKIISIAESWIGVPYLYGGTTRKGVDCSGFVKNVYSEVGINLPRTSGEQFAFAIPVTNPAVGDLVFFKRNGRIYHVGIYIGNDSIIHAAINKGVRVESMKGNSLEKTRAGYGRVSFG